MPIEMRKIQALRDVVVRGHGVVKEGEVVEVPRSEAEILCGIGRAAPAAEAPAEEAAAEEEKKPRKSRKKGG